MKTLNSDVLGVGAGGGGLNAGGRAWAQAAASVAAKLVSALKPVRVAPDGEALDTNRTWAALSQVDESRAVPTTPDGMVAWRFAGPTSDPSATLHDALSKILGR